MPNYNWQIVAGQLPDGISLDQVTGEISGTPTQIGDYTFTVLCTDSDSPPATEQREYTLSVVEEIIVRGDADRSGEIDIDDVVYLIDYIFGGGPAPDPLWTGDADCSTEIDIDDVVYLIQSIFAGGNVPCDIDGDEMPDCQAYSIASLRHSYHRPQFQFHWHSLTIAFNEQSHD